MEGNKLSIRFTENNFNLINMEGKKRKEFIKGEVFEKTAAALSNKFIPKETQEGDQITFSLDLYVFAKEELEEHDKRICQGKMKWISVKDRLPNPKGDWVLVYADGAINCMGYDEKNGFSDWTYARACNINIDSITYWMPLPDPPTN
jgi:hypothetical protein